MLDTTSFKNIHVFEEGLKKTLDERLNLDKLDEYFELTSFDYKTKFVGFIIREEDILISYPKNYETHNINNDDVKKLAKLLMIFSSSLSENFSGESNENFPLDSYLNVCLYYTKYGLYTHSYKTYSKGYMKRINWGKTFSKSDKIIVDGNLYFFPFVVENSNSTEVFLTECMKEVLTVGYEKFGRHFEVGVPFFKKSQYKILENSTNVLGILQNMIAIHNNDETKKLIVSIINFIKWLSQQKENTFFVTKSFETIWQNMVEVVLRKGLTISEEKYEIDFNVSSNNLFRREYSHLIQHLEKENTRNFRVRYDHLLVQESSAFLFDSKYYKDEISDLNYKQLAYNYTLKDYLYRKNNIKNLKIHNALILPTYKEQYSYTHLDTANINHHEFIRNIIIKEHYLNMKQVVNWYLENY